MISRAGNELGIIKGNDFSVKSISVLLSGDTETFNTLIETEWVFFCKTLKSHYEPIITISIISLQLWDAETWVL